MTFSEDAPQGEQQQEGQAAPAEQAQQADPQAEQTRRQARIDSLTRKYREAEREAETLGEQNNVLLSKIEEMTSQIEALSRAQQKKPARNKNPLSDLLDSSATSSDSEGGSNLEGIDKLVESAVQKALNPLIEQQAMSARTQHLRAQQQQAFIEAADDLPDIKRAGSEAQKLFDQIWASNPELQAMPTGPALVVHAVAGLLRQGGHPVADARKAAANIVESSGPMQRLGDLPDQANKAQGVVDALAQKGREQGLDQDELGMLIGLKLGTARLKE